jgi:hypothetical protein
METRFFAALRMTAAVILSSNVILKESVILSEAKDLASIACNEATQILRSAQNDDPTSVRQTE